MNTKRLIVLGMAGVMAIAAALVARGIMGGGTPNVEAKVAQMPMSEVLVANANLQPGQALTADQVRWQKWPTASVDSSFITHEAAGNERNLLVRKLIRHRDRLLWIAGIIAHF